MILIFGVLIIIASIILGLIVLIQNPKGGGLSGSFGGVGNQLMGVKQTTDVLEKGTWVFAALVGILCLVSPAFIPKEGANKGSDLINNISTVPQQKAASPATAPANTATMPVTPDSGK
ncbi:MAG: preprotein translocase subunit SecG [Bacteroidota bacterium]